MWPGVESELVTLLSSNIFRSLLHDRSEYGDVAYLRERLKAKQPIERGLPRMYPGFLFKAGILPEFPARIEQLIPTQRSKLQEAARLEARLMIGRLSTLGALREQRASAELISGMRLFRLWDSRYADSGSETGEWWFSEGLFDVVRGLPAAQQRETLRDLLAVSRDWSNLDRVSSMRLETHQLPAIVAVGLPQRYYSRSMWTKFPEENSPATTARSKEYFSKLDVILQGGKTQYYLPWVPKHLVRAE